MNKNQFNLTLAALWISCLFSCSKKAEEELSAIPTAPPPPAVTAASTEKKEEAPKYVYPHSKKREPFLPLIGGGAIGLAEMKNPFADSESNPAQTFSNLELKGILRDKRGKVALIQSTEGESYTLKSGKIYDAKNRAVSGVAGIIKENGIILISENKTVKELPLLRRGTAPSMATQ